MTEPTALAVSESVELGVISASSPAQLVARATDAANALAGVIQAKKLFSTISGKQYVKCEGWTTLAAMMGCLPREVGVTRRDDGTYEATVELARMSDGAVLTRASAECGMDEPTWKGRADYARRSMAVTRATSKACRIAFSWVMVLAGYEATPSEEIPHEESVTEAVGRRRGKPGAQGAAAVSTPTPQPLTEFPRALAAKEEPMPWEGDSELDPRNHIMPLGANKGKKIGSLKSDVLVAARNYFIGDKSQKYGVTVAAIESVLRAREGEQ